MRSQVAFPFLTLNMDAVRATPWQISVNGEEFVQCGEFLESWDAATLIELRRQIIIDPDIARMLLGYHDETPDLELVLSVGTGKGRFPRHQILVRAWSAKEAYSGVDVLIKLDSAQISSVIDLKFEVVIRSVGSMISRLSPRSAGCRVWHDRLRIIVDGDGARFPIEASPFSNFFGSQMASQAPWMLYWVPGDWNRDFLGACRLLLNTETPLVLKRIEEAEPFALQTLMADVITQIAERFVTDEEIEDLVDSFEPGSLGAQVWTWLKQAWPDNDLSLIRSIQQTNPGVFRAALTALAELPES